VPSTLSMYSFSKRVSIAWEAVSMRVRSIGSFAAYLLDIWNFWSKALRNLGYDFLDQGLVLQSLARFHNSKAGVSGGEVADPGAYRTIVA